AISVRHGAPGRAGGERRRPQGEADRDRVGQHVGRIRDERQRVGDQPEHDLELAPVGVGGDGVGMAAVAVMMVVAVAHRIEPREDIGPPHLTNRPAAAFVQEMSVLDEAPVAVPVRRDLPALAAGLVTVMAWGSAFVGIRAAGHALSPGSIALGRLLVSCAALGTVAAIRREPLPARRDLWQIAAYGVLWLGLYSVALNAAERRVDAGTAAMLVNTGPILIAIMAGI